jgi:hypothetical protein
MARRRRARVALPKWLETFGEINTIVSEALKRAEAENPAAFDFFGSGAIIRVIINHLVLPKVHDMLVKNPGMSVEEAIKKVLASLTPEEVEAAVKKRWPDYPYASKVAEAFEALKKALGVATATAAKA